MLVLVAGALVMNGCADEEVQAASACVDYANPDLFVPEASFEDDVLPIFAHSCNFNACHGFGSSGPQEGLVLGPYEDSASAEERTALIAGLVGDRANFADMDQVVPGDPAASFLLAKLEYTDFVGCEANRCVQLRCGGRMPRADPALSEEKLRIIRTWIRDGAEDN